MSSNDQQNFANQSIDPNKYEEFVERHESVPILPMMERKSSRMANLQKMLSSSKHLFANVKFG